MNKEEKIDLESLVDQVEQERIDGCEEAGLPSEIFGIPVLVDNKIPIGKTIIVESWTKKKAYQVMKEVARIRRENQVRDDEDSMNIGDIDFK
jgi:hypothetical protein